MSEELMKEDNNLTMADLEDHFDDANPWKKDISRRKLYYLLRLRGSSTVEQLLW